MSGLKLMIYASVGERYAALCADCKITSIWVVSALCCALENVFEVVFARSISSRRAKISLRLFASTSCPTAQAWLSAAVGSKEMPSICAVISLYWPAP